MTLVKFMQVGLEPKVLPQHEVDRFFATNTSTAADVRRDLQGLPTADQMARGAADWQLAGDLLLARARALAGENATADELRAAYVKARMELPALAVAFDTKASPPRKITRNNEVLVEDTQPTVRSLGDQLDAAARYLMVTEHVTDYRHAVLLTLQRRPQLARWYAGHKA